MQPRQWPVLTQVSAQWSIIPGPPYLGDEKMMTGACSLHLGSQQAMTFFDAGVLTDPLDLQDRATRVTRFDTEVPVISAGSQRRP